MPRRGRSAEACDAGRARAGILARAAQLVRRRPDEERRRGPSIPPLQPPLEQLAADLTRLAADLDRIERSDLPKKIARFRATGLAYDLVLRDACRALELPLDSDPPFAPGDRLAAELDLARAGLHW